MLMTSQLIRRQIQRGVTTIFPALSRKVSTQTWEFTDSNRGISGVVHHTISAELKDNDPEKMASSIHNTIVSHHDSLFFLTEKSRLLRRDEDNPNFYLPLEKDQLNDISYMIRLIHNRWLRPGAGHTCMAITDCHGVILKDSEVSLRPEKRTSFLSGKTALHPNLYSNLPSSVSRGKQTTITDEILELAIRMTRDKTITADLTVIPLASKNQQLENILENIRSARAIKLYNLCSLVVKKEDINNITDNLIRKYVIELKERAQDFPELQEMVKDESEAVLAALACTHAIAKACYGDTHAIDDRVSPDQDTQTAAVYCAMALLGTEKFLDFARKINFLDDVSNFTKPKIK